MKVEVATPADAAEIAALGRVLHDRSTYAEVPYNEAKVEQHMRSLMTNGGVVFVVRKDGAIVGGIAGAVSAWWFSDELMGYEYSFFIAPPHTNGMAAMRLMSAFRTWCKARGAKSLRVGITTGIHQEKTAAFYRLMGFKDIGPLFELEL
jgi:GNAT superfamily N-acetyltransferase